MPHKWLMREALEEYAKRAGLSDRDREHLRRWRADEKNRIWATVSKQIRHNRFEWDIESACSYLIGRSLRSRADAEGLAADRRLKPAKPNEAQKLRSCEDERELADLIVKVTADLASCFPSSRAPPPPNYDGPIRPPNPRDLERDFALSWLRSKAEELRTRADNPVVDESDRYIDWENLPALVSRQRGGRGKRANSREVAYFVRRMVNTMYELTDRPLYEAVAAVTNIAFPETELIGEDVRSFCRPTTRRGRGTKPNRKE